MRELVSGVMRREEEDETPIDVVLMPYYQDLYEHVLRVNDNLERVEMTDPLVLGVIWRTLRICAIVTVISVAAAYVLTLIWVRGGPVARLVAELCILIPFWISVLTRAFGWLALRELRANRLE